VLPEPAAGYMQLSFRLLVRLIVAGESMPVVGKLSQALCHCKVSLAMIHQWHYLMHDLSISFVNSIFSKWQAWYYCCESALLKC